MEGRSQLSIDSALKVSKYVRVEQIKQIPFLEFFHTIPLLSYVRFAKWEEILSYKKPIDELKTPKLTNSPDDIDVPTH